MEGPVCYADEGCSARTGLAAPIAEYRHNEGCSVTGGYVYRGRRFPELDGVYFYADYCNGTLWGLHSDGETWHNKKYFVSETNITSFGEDEEGEVFAVGHNGDIYRIEPMPEMPGPATPPSEPPGAVSRQYAPRRAVTSTRPQ